MGVAPRKFDRHIKSLMHFDYPYFAEPGDGMRDEIGVLSWTNAGNAKFVGTEIPVAESVTGTPKFGYRCLQTAAMSDYIEAPVLNNYLDMKAAKRYEIEFFIRKTNSAEGNIVAMLDSEGANLFKITTNSANKIAVGCASMNIAGTSSAALTLSTWTHVRVRISEGNVYIYMDGVLTYSGTCELEVQDIAKIRLGGFIGQLDEFLIRDSVSDDNVPGAPYQGYIDTYGIGGTGKQGALSLTSGTTNINSFDWIKTITNTSTFTLQRTSEGRGSEYAGIYGIIQAGDEIMIWKEQKVSGNISGTESGLYAFRKVKDISAGTITLDKPITEMTFTDSEIATNYNFFVYLVPNYTSVNIGASATVSPVSGRSFVVFRCKGNVTINGKILTSGLGRVRYDYFQMTHNHLPERFIMNTGGGVIILSEGTVTAGNSARIGASWSGAGKAGRALTAGSDQRWRGEDGGSGYGGSGGSLGGKRGGAGGVGGGGGAPGDSYIGYDAGIGNNKNAIATGGGNSGNYGFPGTQGVRYSSYGMCGGGALQRSGSTTNTTYSNTNGFDSGACVMIICKTLNVSMNAISTGGRAGGCSSSGAQAHAGGGTGMCYLAYEEAV